MHPRRQYHPSISFKCIRQVMGISCPAPQTIAGTTAEALSVPCDQSLTSSCAMCSTRRLNSCSKVCSRANARPSRAISARRWGSLASFSMTVAIADGLFIGTLSPAGQRLISPSKASLPYPTMGTPHAAASRLDLRTLREHSAAGKTPGARENYV